MVCCTCMIHKQVYYSSSEKNAQAIEVSECSYSRCSRINIFRDYHASGGGQAPARLRRVAPKSRAYLVRVAPETRACLIGEAPNFWEFPRVRAA